MCNRMPQEMIGLASRMKNIRPRITDYPNVELMADNQDLLEQITQIKARICRTLAQDLHNGSIKISLRLAEMDEIVRPMTPKEAYVELMKNNEARKFCESLGMELTM